MASKLLVDTKKVTQIKIEKVQLTSILVGFYLSIWELPYAVYIDGGSYHVF
jgi:hypothetical protein